MRKYAALIGYLILAAGITVALVLVQQQATALEKSQERLIRLVAQTSYDDCQARNELQLKFDDPGELEDCDDARARYLALLEEL